MPIKWNPVLAVVHNDGYVGVELFFVISSFLLTHLLVMETRKSPTGTISVKNFFLRRVLRIWPLYFGFVLAMVVRGAVHGGGVDWAHVISLSTFTENLWTALKGYTTSIPDVAHLWTISLEEQYYLILPFVVPVLLRFSKRVLAVGGAVVIGVFMLNRLIAVIFSMPHPFIWVLPIQGDAFVLGTMLGLGVFDSFLQRVPTWAKFAAAIACLGYTVYLPYIGTGGYPDVIRYTFLAVGFLALMVAVLNSRNKVIDAVFGNRAVRYLGKISYGLYVFHELAISVAVGHIEPALTRAMGSDGWLFGSVFFLIVFALTLAVSALSYEVYEKRFLKLKQRFTAITSRPI
ncbi:MAG: acyltransferase [Propionibacteriaceae bacterium]|nr:acyltransferase [Propionibacteriaceae bacterium]